MNRGIDLALIFFFILNRNGLVLSKQLPTYLRDLRCPKTKEFDACFIENGNKAIPLVARAVYLRDLICPRAKEFDACVLVNGNKTIPFIARGDTEFGIPGMMPLKLPFVRFVSTPSLTVNMTNVEVHGLDKLKILDHLTNIQKGLFSLTLKGENVTIVGNYAADGRILIMPLNGKGRFSLYLKNGQYKSVNSGKVILKNGLEYFEMTDSRFSAKFERITFHLDNLFEGNKQLGDQLNTFLNENWETLLEDFGPSIGNTISKIINDIWNSLSLDVPLKDVFI